MHLGLRESHQHQGEVQQSYQDFPDRAELEDPDRGCRRCTNSWSTCRVFWRKGLAEHVQGCQKADENIAVVCSTYAAISGSYFIIHSIESRSSQTVRIYLYFTTFFGANQVHRFETSSTTATPYSTSPTPPQLLPQQATTITTTSKITSI